MHKMTNLIKPMIRMAANNFNFIKIHPYTCTPEKQITETEPLHLYVGKNQKYTSISQAVNEWLTSFNKVKAVIHIAAGEYLESIKLFGHGYINLSFIGEDKYKVIWRTTTGYYREAPLHVQGNVLIKGITFIADHSDNPKFCYTTLAGVHSVWKENCGGAYALHVHFQGEGKTRIEDCILISHQNAALGCGTEANQEIEIINCDLRSYTDKRAITEISYNGAMLYHTSTKPKQYNQKLMMHDVRLFSQHFNAMAYKVHSREPNVSMVEFIRCHFSSGAAKREICFIGIGHVNLSRNSRGNNVEKCNS